MAVPASSTICPLVRPRHQTRARVRAENLVESCIGMEFRETCDFPLERAIGGVPWRITLVMAGSVAWNRMQSHAPRIRSSYPDDANRLQRNARRAVWCVCRIANSADLPA